MRTSGWVGLITSIPKRGSPLRQHIGIDVAGIEQMLTGQHVGFLQIGLNDFCHAHIALGSRGRGHMNEQVRLVCFTSFRQMDLVG